MFHIFQMFCCSEIQTGKVLKFSVFKGTLSIVPKLKKNTFAQK